MVRVLGFNCHQIVLLNLFIALNETENANNWCDVYSGFMANQSGM